jgi:hypothetical protein
MAKKKKRSAGFWFGSHSFMMGNKRIDKADPAQFNMVEYGKKLD